MISNWLLNRNFISLRRDAEPIIDYYLLGLGAAPALLQIKTKRRAR
jgi:hypothetical protein